MKQVTKMAAQGDVIFRRVKEIPANAIKVAREDGPLVVAHSETQHHHAIDSKALTHFAIPGDSLVCYLRMDEGCEDLGGVDVVHHRPFDTHETLRLLGKPNDVWEVRRQREWRPEGWVRVND